MGKLGMWSNPNSQTSKVFTIPNGKIKAEKSRVPYSSCIKYYRRGKSNSELR